MTIIDLEPPELDGTSVRTLRREIPGGLIEFEEAPVGSPTKAGTPRKVEHRAYFWTPDGGERERFPSVTTGVLDTIVPKGGLPHWSEGAGIVGTIRAIRRGFIDPHEIGEDEAVERVRALKFGAERARGEAAARGLNVHRLLEVYMTTGEAPAPNDHPPEHAGYVRGLCNWLLKADPQPMPDGVGVEELVCSPTHGYAGRRDLRSLHPDSGLDFLMGWDAKTNTAGCIYRSAHEQLRLYETAGIEDGDRPCDGLTVVVFDPFGGFDEMPCLSDEETALAGLRYWKRAHPIDLACDAHNRAAKKAAKAR